MKDIARKFGQGLIGLSLLLSTSAIPALASSHAEAPLISMDRFADNTDTYAFRSVEPGREGFVTLIANYIPLQEPSSGPQFFRFDDTVLYEIKVDNTGDGIEDVTYQFQFNTEIFNDDTVLGMHNANEDAVINSNTDIDYNMPQTYTVRRVERTSGRRGQWVSAGRRTPPNNIGPRVTPNYEANLGQPAVYPLANGGKVFAGTRDEYFYVDLGGVFDAFNLRTINTGGAGLFVGNGVDTTQGYNVSTIAIEVPIQELTRNRAVPTGPTDPNAVIGVWATASRRTTRVLGTGTATNDGAWTQVSRLGSPLVNELVIPLKLKDAFNSIPPSVDGTIPRVVDAILDPQFPKYVKYALLVFYGLNINIPPPPRNDLVQIFATGIPVNAVTGPNYTTFLSDGVPHEYLRLNTAIPITPIATINRLGLLGGDVAGFPNGRRPHDDAVDIVLRAALGGTPFTPAFNVAPNKDAGDGVSANPEGPLLTRFPYLLPPNPGNTPRMSNIRPATGFTELDLEK